MQALPFTRKSIRLCGSFKLSSCAWNEYLGSLCFVKFVAKTIYLFVSSCDYLTKRYIGAWDIHTYISCMSHAILHTPCATVFTLYDKRHTHHKVCLWRPLNDPTRLPAPTRLRSQYSVIRTPERVRITSFYAPPTFIELSVILRQILTDDCRNVRQRSETYNWLTFKRKRKLWGYWKLTRKQQKSHSWQHRMDINRKDGRGRVGWKVNLIQIPIHKHNKRP